MRLNNYHTDRIVWMCRADALEARKKELEVLTDTAFDGPYHDEDKGVQVCENLSAGFQILAPIAETDANQQLREALDARGEGVFAVLFGVPDLEAAKRHALEQGFEPGEYAYDFSHAPWATGTVESAGSALISTVIDTLFVYVECEYPDALFEVQGSNPGWVRNTNRFDHLAYLCSPESHGKWQRELEKLGCTRLDGPYDRHDVGVRCAISWPTGLEVVTAIPGSEEPFAQGLKDLLESRGEHLFAIVHNVPDIHAAMEHARQAGYAPGHVIDADPDAPWDWGTVAFAESSVCEFMGSMFFYGGIEYPDTVFKTRRA